MNSPRVPPIEPTMATSSYKMYSSCTKPSGGGYFRVNITYSLLEEEKYTNHMQGRLKMNLKIELILAHAISLSQCE